MNYGRAIRVLRAAQDMTQDSLGEAAGITSSYVSLIEAGEREPSLRVLHAMAQHLRAPMVLLVLLASEPEDLGDIQASEVDLLAKHLLRVLQGPGPVLLAERAAARDLEAAGAVSVAVAWRKP